MMALIAKESGGSSTFTPVPQGMHLARCYRVVDLGTQKSEYLGTVKHLPKVMLQFEVHGEDESGKPMVTSKGEPMTISKNFTLSLAEKATLRKDLQTWRGRDFTADELRGFELKNVLGAWAMVSVVKATGNNGKEYTNIQAILSVPPQIKKAGLPDGHNALGIFSIDEPDMTMFETFSDGLKSKIEGSPEWQDRNGNSAPKQASSDKSGFDDMDDDIPF
jgi:hypothetical protein